MEDLSCHSSIIEDNEQPSTERKMKHKPDGKWSFVVCGSVMITQMLTISPMWSFGVLFPAMLEYFDTNKAAAATVSSICIATVGISAPVAGKLCTRYQCRTVNICGLLIFTVGYIFCSFSQRIEVLYFSYGILGGIAASFVQISNIAIIAKYFSKYQSSATGTSMAGAMIGYFVIAAVGQRLVDSVGLMNVFRIYSGAAFLPIFINSWVYDPSIELKDIGSEDNKQRLVKKKTCFTKFIDCSLLRHRRYFYFIVSMALYYFSLLVVSTHIGRYCLDVGIAKGSLFTLFMGMSASNLAGRILIGKLGDFKRLDKMQIIQCLTIIMGISTSLLPSLHILQHLITCTSIISFAEGGVQALTPLAIFGIVGPMKFPQAMGLFLFMMAPFVSSGPFVTGFIADKTGDYVISFYITASSFIAAGILNILFLMFCLKHEDKQENTEYENEEIYMILEKETVL